MKGRWCGPREEHQQLMQVEIGRHLTGAWGVGAAVLQREDPWGLFWRWHDVVRRRLGGREFQILVVLPEKGWFMYRSRVKLGGSRRSNWAFLESWPSAAILIFSEMYEDKEEWRVLGVVQAVLNWALTSIGRHWRERRMCEMSCHEEGCHIFGFSEWT